MSPASDASPNTASAIARLVPRGCRKFSFRKKSLLRTEIPFFPPLTVHQTHSGIQAGPPATHFVPMAQSSGDESDSRTASVARQRSTANKGSNSGSSHSSRSSSQHRNKRQRRVRGDAGKGDVRDFVPRGATFSANGLGDELEDETSSSGEDDDDKKPQTNPYAGTTAQAVNWNQGSLRSVKTSLGGRRNMKNQKPENKKPEGSPEGNKPEDNEPESKANAQFDAVNGAYWRSGSASASEDGETGEKDNDTEEGEVHEDETAGNPLPQSSGDSDDSESLDSRADETIMLNIGVSRPDEKPNGEVPSDDDYDPENQPILGISMTNGETWSSNEDTAKTKEDAIRAFSQRYPTAPAVMHDLVGDDKHIQSRFWYWKQIEDVQAPVSCIECLQEGHMADVCPSKECTHCGAWNQHDSNFCPSWRRCQRCRERGHDEPQCSSFLKSSASEVPCDLCGSREHQEFECDYIWKLPLRESSGPVLVSVSCAYCTSNNHLIGDCPHVRRKRGLSSWTLQGFNPEMVTNINSVIPGRRGGGAGGPMLRGQRGGGGGLKLRGRAEQRSPTPDSDEDMLARPGRRPPLGRPGGSRGNIRIGGGIGRGKNLGPNYRDRQDSLGDRSRPRSLSPDYRSDRGRGGGGGVSWNGRPRSPPRGGRGGRGRGGGRGGGKRGGGGDVYRPSSGKKPWGR